MYTIKNNTKILTSKCLRTVYFAPRNKLTLDTYNLKVAFKRIKANKGAPGIDGITIEEYEQDLEGELNQLKEEVQSWSYKPTPVNTCT